MTVSVNVIDSLLSFSCGVKTRIKLAVTSPSRHFREHQRLGKNTAKSKTSKYAKKSSKNMYYGKIVL